MRVWVLRLAGLFLLLWGRLPRAMVTILEAILTVTVG